MSFARDTLLIFRRQMRLSLRNPAWVIIGLVQPILYLLFFGPLLTRIAGGGIPGFPGGNAYSFFVPGLLIQLGLFGAAFVGFSIIADWRVGVVERLRVTSALPIWSRVFSAGTSVGSELGRTLTPRPPRSATRPANRLQSSMCLSTTAGSG